MRLLPTTRGALLCLAIQRLTWTGRATEVRRSIVPRLLPGIFLGRRRRLEHWSLLETLQPHLASAPKRLLPWAGRLLAAPVSVPAPADSPKQSLSLRISITRRSVAFHSN